MLGDYQTRLGILGKIIFLFFLYSKSIQGGEAEVLHCASYFLLGVLLDPLGSFYLDTFAAAGFYLYTFVVAGFYLVTFAVAAFYLDTFGVAGCREAVHRVILKILRCTKRLHPISALHYIL